MNYLDFFNKKYTHIDRNNNGHITRNIVKNTFNIVNKILAIIPKIAGLINPITQAAEIISRKSLKRIMS
tara:strand:- start:224 stop:430 length:207 start_codon:yes stop_codon:yes gene_type:complete